MKLSQVRNGATKISQEKKKVWKFRKWLRNSLVLDSSSDSLPCTLDWFGKGFEALQNLDSSCNLAAILLCHGLYQVLPHSWLVLMIKNLSKTSKLAKNWLVMFARVLNVPIKLKGNKYYSKVFKRVYKKLWKSTFWVVITRSIALGSGCYEQLRIVEDMDALGCHGLRPLVAMKNSGMWMIWTILGHEPKALNVMNSLGLWKTWMTQGHKLRA